VPLWQDLFIYQISVLKKTERSDTIILGILVHFRQFRHLPDLLCKIQDKTSER
jgi:hypothetical protein